MIPEAVKSFFEARIEMSGRYYANDLRAMDHEDLASNRSSCSRTPYDFTYELVVTNRRFAQRLRGEPTDPISDGWIVAPPHFRDKEAAIKSFETGIEELLDAWRNLPVEDLLKPIQFNTHQGTALDLGWFCAFHTGYHDAQLNYIQSMNGDTEVHWD